jgi:hypothetical protein
MYYRSEEAGAKDGLPSVQVRQTVSSCTPTQYSPSRRFGQPPEHGTSDPQATAHPTHVRDTANVLPWRRGGLRE